MYVSNTNKCNTGPMPLLFFSLLGIARFNFLHSGIVEKYAFKYFWKFAKCICFLKYPSRIIKENYIGCSPLATYQSVRTRSLLQGNIPSVLKNNIFFYSCLCICPSWLGKRRRLKIKINIISNALEGNFSFLFFL